MDNSQDLCSIEPNVNAVRERTPEHCTSSTTLDSTSRLFERQRPIRQIMGRGKVADVILWKCRSIPLGIIAIATVVWLVYELSGLSFVTISSDILLILVVLQFVRANSAVLLNKQLQPLPELVLSEEMVNNAAVHFRVKINRVLLMAHDITLGKDFKFFFKVVVALWLMSVIGTYFSLFTLLYVGTLFSTTIPALYDRYEEHVNRYAGLVQSKISEHYKMVDANVISRFPRSFSKKKAT